GYRPMVPAAEQGQVRRGQRSGRVAREECRDLGGFRQESLGGLVCARAYEKAAERDQTRRNGVDRTKLAADAEGRLMLEPRLLVVPSRTLPLAETVKHVRLDASRPQRTRDLERSVEVALRVIVAALVQQHVAEVDAGNGLAEAVLD